LETKYGENLVAEKEKERFCGELENQFLSFPCLKRREKG